MKAFILKKKGMVEGGKRKRKKREREVASSSFLFFIINSRQSESQRDLSGKRQRGIKKRKRKRVQSICISTRRAPRASNRCRPTQHSKGWEGGKEGKRGKKGHYIYALYRFWSVSCRRPIRVEIEYMRLGGGKKGGKEGGGGKKKKKKRTWFSVVSQVDNHGILSCRDTCLEGHKR